MLRKESPLRDFPWEENIRYKCKKCFTAICGSETRERKETCQV